MNKLFLAFIIFYFVFNLTTPVYAHDMDLQSVESAASAVLQTDSINTALNFERVGFLNILSGISLNTLSESTPLLLIFLTFVLIQTGLLRKFQSPILIFARRFLILSIAVSITIAFVPGILNLKPKEAQAAVPAGVIIGWAGTAASIPAGWSRVTALDARFVKQIATSTTAPGATGGTSTHVHPYTQHSAHTFPSGHNHAGSWGTSSEYPHQIVNNTGTTAQVIGLNNAGHSHASSSVGAAAITVTNNSVGDTDTAASDPPYVTVIFIKSDGTPAGVPVNGVLWFNGATPTGFAAYAALDNRLMKGATTGADGGTQAGATAHTHAKTHTHPLTAGHTHVVSLDGGGTDVTVNSENTFGPRAGHTHALGTSGGPNVEPTVSNATETSASGDFDPPWQKMRAIQKTASVGTAIGMIAMWDGTLASIPSSWKLSDGTSGTPNLSQDKYVRAAATDVTVGDLGGATTHTHAAGTAHTHDSAGSHTHAFTGASGNSTPNANLTYGQSTTADVAPQHTHTSTTYTSPAVVGVGTSSSQANALVANAATDPVFTGVAYIQFQNATPNAPTIMGLSPIPGSKPNKDGGNISLQATATDPDVADTVQVEWDYSANSGGVWTNIGTTTLGAQGTQTLSWNASGLTPGSTYRLRARTKDNGGAISGYTTQIADWTLTSGCSPPVGGDLIISVSCAFVETVDGVDAGNITINTSVTLTINASQTVAFNSAKSITVNGSIAVNSTGQVKQTNLWMVDADADGWPASTTQTAQDSSPGGTYRRRNLLQSQTIIDCNDAVSSSTNSC